jgi:ceramide glucosyltransferase
MMIVVAGVPLVEAVIAACLLISCALYLIALYSAHEFVGRARRAPAADGPAVTVLRPLKGLDPGLYENLLSLCRQRYSRFQLICGVADAKDPAAGLVRRLEREHPEVDIELVVDARTYGSNYKISNLHNMMRFAKHDIIVLADSDIRVGPDYLGRLVAELDDRRNGLVTCLYRAVNAGGLPTLVETLFINTDFANLILLARKVEKATYAFGATIAMRREVLDEIGGFLPLANYLADDYQLGNRVAERGYRLALSDEVVDTVIALGTWRRLFDHQLRWARTYRICRPGGYFGSIVTHGTFWALLNVLYHQFNPASCAASLAVVGLRYASAAHLLWRCLGVERKWLELLLVVPKDLFVSAVWFLAFAGNTVLWSGRRFRVTSTGEMVDLFAPTPVAPTDWQESVPPPAAEERRRSAGGKR